MALEELTDELVLAIFSYFDAQTLLTCSCVCTRWLQVSNTQCLWKKLVLKKWPSQHWLYSKVPASCLNWSVIYREFTQYNWYSADEMKYFTFCTTVENEPIALPLRQAIIDRTNSIKKKWTQFEVLDHNEDFINRHFNQNMELLFSTQSLNWVFLDKRRGYMEELFKKKDPSKTKCYIRPYQVIPSCLVMYRWLCLFRRLATVEPGLTFYRIWRFRLKHVETGLVFELCDWKAAMSSTFSNGKPNVGSFLNDALELLQLVTHPHFIMHPLGLHPRIQRTFHYEIRASAGGNIFRSRKPSKRRRSKPATSIKSRSPIISPKGNAEFIFGEQLNSDNYFPDIDEKLEKWRARRRMALLAPFKSHTSESNSMTSSYVTSDTEMDMSTEEMTENVASDDESDCDYGYVTNCAYYITSSQRFDNIEEQHSLQASIADNWMFTPNEGTDKIAVLYDIGDESWYFQTEKNIQHTRTNNTNIEDNADEDIIGNAVKKLHLQIPSERFVQTTSSLSPPLYFDYYSTIFEAIPSALALYRLICLFEVNSSMYNSFDKTSVWNLSVVHKKTGGIINFVDYNGMFQVYVSTADISMPENDKLMLDNLLSEFRASVTQLLDLLMSDDFSHPYGAIAGAVA